MVVSISLSDPDSVKSLATMLMALDSTGVLESHDEMVVETVVEQCYAQEPMLDPDAIDDDIAALRKKVQNK